MSTAFRFKGCTEIRESLGLRADNERDLMERIETVPAESVYYHSVRSLLRRQVGPTRYLDDFAAWVATEVRDPALAERLAFSTPFDFPDIESFREHLLGILDDHLSNLRFAPRALHGGSFYFQRSHLVAIPLDVEARDVGALRAGVAAVDESSIYYHTVEAIRRSGDPRGDLAAWAADALHLPALASELQEIDPFVMSLAGTRQRLLVALDRAAASEGAA
jgi:hypothetical protein